LATTARAPRSSNPPTDQSGFQVWPRAYRASPRSAKVRFVRFTREVVPMHRMKIAALTATVALSALAGLGGQAGAQSVTDYEGARVIVGEGRVLDNTTLVVSGTKIVQVGGAVPAGATRVNLAGKTVMPMLLDTHTHLSTTRDKLVLDLRQRAYFGVGAALSLG